MYVSYNMLSIYGDCPRKYKFQYVDGLAKLYRQEKPYLSFGESLHKALEEFFKNPDAKSRTKENLLGILSRVWVKKGFSSEDEEKQYLRDAERLLGIFFDTQDVKVKPFRVEEFFRVPMKDFFLTGRMDRIDILPGTKNKLEIIDYKTGKYMPTQEAFDKDLQMSLYALGALKKYPEYSPEKISVYYFQHGQKLTTTRAPEQLAEVESDLEARVAAIASDTDYEPRETPFCRSCDYLLICPLMGVCATETAGKTRLDEHAGQQALLEEELKKTKEHYVSITQDLYALHNYSLDISSTLDSKILAQKISAAFRGIAAASRSALFFWDVGEGKFVLTDSHNLDFSDDFAIEENKIFSFSGGCDFGLSASDTFSRDNPFCALFGTSHGLKNYVVTPLVTKDKVFGLMALADLAGARRSTNKHLQTVLTSLADQAAVAIYNSSLYRYAIYDGLTKLFRGSHFQERLKIEMARARRTGEKLTLVMCDLDNFKKVNDTYGHIEGDRVLREFGKAVRTKTRGTDICGRYGGEEFAVLLPSTDVPGAANVAENIRAHAASYIKMSDGKPATASFGVAAWDASMNNPSDFVHKADEALYKAKQSGKNRVVSV